MPIRCALLAAVRQALIGAISKNSKNSSAEFFLYGLALGYQGIKRLNIVQKQAVIHHVLVVDC